LKGSKRRNSYTSADSLPLKVIMDTDVIDNIQRSQVIPPIHAQLLPTNKCNMNCSFCSCSEVAKDQEIPYENIEKIVDKLSTLKTKAVTITGGGEPLMHPQINETIKYFGQKGIEVGLVTNGKLLHKLEEGQDKYITWCRISNSDERTFSDSYKSKVQRAIELNPKIDWAFSHVTSPKPNYSEIERIVTFANDYDMTHVRLVADLFTPEEVDMERIKTHFKYSPTDDFKVIYQGRKDPRKGGDCYIGYLKPLIGADEMVYACCGVQYALEEPTKDLPKELCLGSVDNLEEIIVDSSIPLDGSICKKCYYTDYNDLLGSMLKGVEHSKFV